MVSQSIFKQILKTQLDGNKGRRVATDFKNLIIKMRNGVDKEKILNKTKEFNNFIELGNYLTGD